jgi:hypothetical protein
MGSSSTVSRMQHEQDRLTLLDLTRFSVAFRQLPAGKLRTLLRPGRGLGPPWPNEVLCGLVRVERWERYGLMILTLGTHGGESKRRGEKEREGGKPVRGSKQASEGKKGQSLDAYLPHS